MTARSLREALERQLDSMPVMTYENNYPVQALSKATLLGLLELHRFDPETAAELGYNIVNQLADLWQVPVDVRQATNDHCWDFVAGLIKVAPARGMAEAQMTRPTAPDWGGEETGDGTHLYHHAWDSDDGELRLWVGPYSGSLDGGWAVTVDATSTKPGKGHDIVMHCTPDQIIEWANNVVAAVEDSRRDAQPEVTATPSPPAETRDRVEQVLRDHAVGRHVPKEAAGYRAVIADAVVAVVAGSES